MSNKDNRGSYLQGITRLLTDATIGVTDVVETMHHRVVHPPFLPSTPIQHLITNIAGFTYKNIRWSTQLIGGSLDKALGQLSPILGKIKSSDKKEAISSALNGVVGDYLEEKENPLQITMQFRHLGKAIPLDCKSIDAAYPKINGRLLLMVHGSCLNDIKWTRKEHNHGGCFGRRIGQNTYLLALQQWSSYFYEWPKFE